MRKKKRRKRRKEKRGAGLHGIMDESHEGGDISLHPSFIYFNSNNKNDNSITKKSLNIYTSKYIHIIFSGVGGGVDE